MNIMFAKRVRGIDISGIRKMFEGAGPNSINLGLGQPDFDTPDHIKEAAIEAIRRGETGYTVGLGIPQLRDALCDKFQRENGIEVKPEEVIVTSGASEALHIALLALVDRGDKVLIANPGFVSYNALSMFSGAKPVGVPLTEDLRMTPEAVAECITNKTKVLIVNSPGNPTGTVQTEKELRGFVDLCEDHDLTMISDEVYEHFIYRGNHFSPASISDRVITVNAVSKTYSMTGWRLGYAAATGECTEQMLKAHQYVQACASSISQWAALAAMTGPQDCVREMREEYLRRRDFLLAGFREMGVECVVPEGAFYAFPSVNDGTAKAMELIKKGVIVVPGSAFGDAPDNMRVTYSASIDDIGRALKIMEGVIP